MKSGGTPKEQARRRTEVDIYNDVIFLFFYFLFYITILLNIFISWWWKEQ